MTQIEQVINNISKLNQKDQIHASLQIIRKTLLSNFKTFCIWLGYKDINDHTHKNILSCLQSGRERIVIVCPRGSLKSTIGSIAYPLWCALRDPNDRILIDSEVYSNSVTHINAIKSHIVTDRFQTVFGDLRGDVWREDAITLKGRTKVYREPTISAGGIETTRVGLHYSRIIGDDYNSMSNSDTKEKCQKVIQHFRMNLNILEPHGQYCVIGTRYSENDLIGFILREILDLKELAEGSF